MDVMQGKRELIAGRFTLRDLFVDFLGSLVPGLLFVTLVGLTLVWPALSLCRSIQIAITPESKLSLVYIPGVFETFKWEFVVFILVLSYIAGCLFFRQDPKNPDERSFRYIKNKVDQDNWPVRVEADGSADVQFPYRYMYEYLVSRGLKHLAELVPWKGNVASTWKRRTKMFINILKIRLNFFFPEKCGLIARNEAHIRLMSSIWYLARTMQYVAGLGLVLSVLASILFGSQLQVLLAPQCFGQVGSCIVVILAALWIRRTIERFLQYQRVREVTFVLETAYIASLEKPEIIKDLGLEEIEPDKNPSPSGPTEDG